MRTVQLGPIPVGDGHPTVFVAETGSFFNKEVETACQYLDVIARSGADIFKTEIIHRADICLPHDQTLVAYNHLGGKKTENYREHVERKQLSLADYATIFDHARKLDMPFLATVFDFEGVDFLKSAGGCAMKISRNNINNVPLIRYAARAGLPLIFDEGFVYLDELAAALRWAREAGCEDFVINYHPGLNPAPAARHNLRVIETYKETFGLPIGLACHFRGEEILYAAIGAGVNLLEKGVDADPDRIEADLISATPLSCLPGVVEKVKACWSALGSPHPVPPEPRDLVARACIVVAADLPAGTVIEEKHLRFAWPALGISVSYWDRILGASSVRALREGEPLHWSDLRLDDC
ncbi:pseudaminic acid synthase [soil metagenome]